MTDSPTRSPITGSSLDVSIPGGYIPKETPLHITGWDEFKPVINVEAPAVTVEATVVPPHIEWPQLPEFPEIPPCPTLTSPDITVCPPNIDLTVNTISDEIEELIKLALANSDAAIDRAIEVRISYRNTEKIAALLVLIILVSAILIG